MLKWHCIMATLTNDAIIAFRHEFEHIKNNQTYTPAPLLLKMMMCLATLANKGTRRQLKH